jgi:hypothetical protein
MRMSEILAEEYDYDDGKENPYRDLATLAQVKALYPGIVRVAQRVYDDWDEANVDDYAGGGICHLIADEICSVLWEKGITCTTVSSDHEQHVYVVFQVQEGVYSLDIHWSHYETGGGFSWKKIPNIVFDPGHVSLYRISSDPGEFNNIAGVED